jgi:hypothetical protein
LSLAPWAALGASFTYTPIQVGTDAPNDIHVSGIWNDIAVGSAYDANGNNTAFTWTAGQATIVPALPGFNAVSDAGLAIAGGDTVYSTYDMTTGATKTIALHLPKQAVYSIQGVTAAGAVLVSAYRHHKGGSLNADDVFNARGRKTVIAPFSNASPAAVAIADDDTVGLTDDQDHATPQIYSRGAFKTFTIPGAGLVQIAFVSSRKRFGGFWIVYNPFAVHGFVTDGKTVTSFDPPGSVRTEPAASNANGTIAGTYTDSAGAQHGFLYSAGTFTLIDYPGAVQTALTGISATGALIGAYTATPGDNPDHSFMATCPTGQTCTQ